MATSRWKRNTNGGKVAENKRKGVREEERENKEKWSK